MADVHKTLETIFIEAAKVFGEDESKKLLSKVFEQKIEKKVEKKTTSKDEEKSTKRIGRMTQTLANKLKAELVKVGVEFSDNEKKEFDKFKKELVSYIDDLTGDDFTAKGLEKHIEDFANLHRPITTTIVDEKKHNKGSSNAASNTNIPTLTLKELQSIETIATPSGGEKGVYWDADEGRHVRGPIQEDEELVEIGFGKKTYMVGEITGRVYEESADEGPDVFQGFVGVGVFRDMKMP